MFIKIFMKKLYCFDIADCGSIGNIDMGRSGV